MINLVSVLVLTIVIFTIEAASLNNNTINKDNSIDNTSTKGPTEKNNIKTKDIKLNESRNETSNQEKKEEFIGAKEYSNMTKDNKNISNTSTEQNKIKTKDIKLNESRNKTNNQEEKEECIGAKEYCNLTKDEYMEMMNNYIYPQTYEWILIATHTSVFVIGLVGNALVCIAVFRNHSMRTVTNYFIVNLAVADFMVILLCLPPTVLWDVTETWFFGNAMCKIVLYLQSVSVTVSVLTLTFISLDRWYAICFPLRFKYTTGRAKTAIFIIWAVSLAFNAPELVVLATEVTIPLRFELGYLVQCSVTWSPSADLLWHILKLALIYTIPLMLMTVAHYQIVRVLWSSDKIPGQAETDKLAPAEKIQLRSRKKAAKMLAAVVLMFAICYLPVHVLSMLRYSSLNLEQSDALTCLALVSHVLCYANSAINPLIYNCMSGTFRREFRRSFGCATKPPPRSCSSTQTRLTMSRRHDACDMKRHSGYHTTNTAFF